MLKKIYIEGYCNIFSDSLVFTQNKHYDLNQARNDNTGVVLYSYRYQTYFSIVANTNSAVNFYNTCFTFNVGVYYKLFLTIEDFKKTQHNYYDWTSVFGKNIYLDKILDKNDNDLINSFTI